ISPGVRAVGIEAGPRRAVEKERLPLYVEHFVRGIRAFSATRRSRYDLVHSHYWQSGLVAKELVSGWGVPMVHSHHTLGRVKNSFLAPGDYPEPPSRLQGEAEVIRAADVLIASTDDDWQQLACMYDAPQEAIKTIHPGVDHGLFHPGDRAQARRRLGLGAERMLLAVGRIQPLKGLDLAIRALDELVRAVDRPLVLTLVGGASGRSGEDELRRLRRLVDSLGLRDRVRFAGPQPHSSLPLFYRAADALVVCSYSESFGLAALEAHACGTPVVATPVGGLSFIVRDGESGWLVDTRDAGTFSPKLRILLEDDDLRAAFAECAARSARRFSWDRTAAALLDLYECLTTGDLPEVCTAN
ncbi:MAG: glycosyltransferase, partial [Actinomycetota bacterium]|nr:glycosyltransferase [Actinomycetota bacterium]